MRDDTTARVLKAVIACCTAAQATAVPAWPARAAEQDPAPAVLILDSSNSMWGQIRGRNRVVIAREVLTRIFSDYQGRLDLGLVSYGHRSKTSCRDIQTVLATAPLDAARHGRAVRRLNPAGKTPISRSLDAAAETLGPATPNGHILLLTDGVDNCGPDPCETSATLKSVNPGLSIHVIAFSVAPEQHSTLRCIADNSGGRFAAAEDEIGLAFAADMLFGLIARNRTHQPAPRGVGAAGAAANDTGDSGPAAIGSPPRPPVSAGTETAGTEMTVKEITGTIAAATPVAGVIPAGTPVPVPVPSPRVSETTYLPGFAIGPDRVKSRAAGKAGSREAAPGTPVSSPSPSETPDLHAQSILPPGSELDPSRAEATHISGLVMERRPERSAGTGKPAAGPGAVAAATDTSPGITGALPAGGLGKRPPSAKIDLGDRPVPRLPDEVRPTFLISEEAAGNGDEGLRLRGQITSGTAPITRPIDWAAYRVEDAEADRWRKIADVSTPVASIPLPPGRYVVRAAYGAVRAAKVLVVRPGRRIDATFILNAGGLRILPALAFMDTPEGVAAKHWIFAAVPDENGRRRLFAQSDVIGEVIRLNAGTYSLVSRFGNANAVVETDVTIRPGMLTAVEINHKVGLVTLRLSGAAQETASGGPVKWQLVDSGGAIVFRAEGRETAQVLLPGRYRAMAEYRGKSYTSEFTVEIGEKKTVEITAG